MVREKTIELEIRRYLRTLPQCWHWKVHDANTSGIPDIVGCYKGKFFGLEVKKPGGGIRKLQTYVLNQIDGAGGISSIVRSVDDVRKALKERT